MARVTSVESKLKFRRLSGIHAAWHFWYAVSFDGEVGLRKLGLGGIHPLTRRYV
ncbi:DUF3265 domain-containing protein [Vibrio vulnificus]|nr:DUF3265 domain-containing protein [Vibrio vulnificus]MCD1422790.1 DUF3265 domain-containing protein [Vibrio vulnificus]